MIVDDFWTTCPEVINQSTKIQNNIDELYLKKSFSGMIVLWLLKDIYLLSILEYRRWEDYMRSENKNRTKIKGDKQIEPLFNRWQEEEFGKILKTLKDDKKISKKTPKFENKYDFRYVNLRKTRLNDVNISDACLDAIVGFNLFLKKSHIINCIVCNGDLESSNISDSRLEDSNFIKTSFKNSVIKNSSLSQSRFNECDFSGAEFIEINVENSIIEDSIFGTIVNPEKISVSGIPKSLKGSKIDRKSLILLPSSEFKNKLLKEGVLMDSQRNFKYDVALSFAGEDRDFVEQVATKLVSNGVKVFYDEFEKHDLWGKELVSYLTELYEEKCQFVIIFASENYNIKGWTNVERIASLSRILSGEYDNILPVKMDDSVIKGLTKSKGYLDAKTNTPEEIANNFIKKLIQEM